MLPKLQGQQHLSSVVRTRKNQGKNHGRVAKQSDITNPVSPISMDCIQQSLDPNERMGPSWL